MTERCTHEPCVNQVAAATSHLGKGQMMLVTRGSIKSVCLTFVEEFPIFLCEFPVLLFQFLDLQIFVL